MSPLTEAQACLARIDAYDAEIAECIANDQPGSALLVQARQERDEAACVGHLRAAVAAYGDAREQGRRDGIEAAAKVAEDYDGDGLSPGTGYDRQLGDAALTAREIAAAIRNLKPVEPA